FAGLPRGSGPSRSDLTRSLDAGLLDDVQTLQVLLGAAVQRVVELVLDVARDLARLADRVVVDLPHRDQLRGGPGEEDLVRQVQLGGCAPAPLVRVTGV